MVHRRRTEDRYQSLAGYVSDGLKGLIFFFSLYLWIKVGIVGTSRPYLTLLLAVIPPSAACALEWGLSGGLIAAGVTGLAGWFLIMPPELSFQVASVDDVFYMTAMMLSAVVVSILCGDQRMPKTFRRDRDE